MVGRRLANSPKNRRFPKTPGGMMDDSSSNILRWFLCLCDSTHQLYSTAADAFLLFNREEKMGDFLLMKRKLYLHEHATSYGLSCMKAINDTSIGLHILNQLHNQISPNYYSDSTSSTVLDIHLHL